MRAAKPNRDHKPIILPRSAMAEKCSPNSQDEEEAVPTAAVVLSAGEADELAALQDDRESEPEPADASESEARPAEVMMSSHILQLTQSTDHTQHLRLCLHRAV